MAGVDRLDGWKWKECTWTHCSGGGTVPIKLPFIQGRTRNCWYWRNPTLPPTPGPHYHPTSPSRPHPTFAPSPLDLGEEFNQDQGYNLAILLP